MKSKKNLVLVGMMGSGKSTIGYILSKRLNLKFVDIDKKIEIKEGCSINEIFSKKGEEYFRKLEEIESLEYLNNEKLIISLGGGAFLNKKIQKTILKDHISFWLNWKSSTLIKRIKNSKKRPIVINYNDRQIKKLINERSEIYNKSNFKIDCENLNKNEIVNKILNIYEKL